MKAQASHHLQHLGVASKGVRHRRHLWCLRLHRRKRLVWRILAKFLQALAPQHLCDGRVGAKDLLRLARRFWACSGIGLRGC